MVDLPLTPGQGPTRNCARGIRQGERLLPEDYLPDGHGTGLEGHESPWIAEGDRTVLREGMTFSCEPGVYDPEFGGFRHSDTVVVRKERGEILNRYPTRLADMIIEI